MIPLNTRSLSKKKKKKKIVHTHKTTPIWQKTVERAILWSMLTQNITKNDLFLPKTIQINLFT